MAQRISKSTPADSGQLRNGMDALLCRAAPQISERLPVLGQCPDLGAWVHYRPADLTAFVDQKTAADRSTVVFVEHAVAAAHLAMGPEIRQQGELVLLLLMEHFQCRQGICRYAVQLNAIGFEQLDVVTQFAQLVGAAPGEIGSASCRK